MTKSGEIALFHMSRFAAAALAAANLSLAAWAPSAAADTRPVVQIDTGAVVGVETGGIAAFKGIPYAAPPVGPLRWKPPEPAAAWSTPRDASQFGAACPQSHGAAAQERVAASRRYLLGLLLRDEVARETDALLQCLRYVVRNDFFDDKTAT